MSKSKITIHTDGACSNNGKPNACGGWAAILQNDTKQLRISAGERDTTNQRMELKPAIEGLKAVKNKQAEILLVTDSKYVEQGCSEWLANWKSKGWRTASNKQVKNQDLWQEMDTLLEQMNVKFQWVKGHSGHPLNELADRLAVNAIGQGRQVKRLRLVGNQQ